MFKPKNNQRRKIPEGYFGIGIENVLSEENLGTLWRSAYLLGANYIFTIGKKYKLQRTDTTKTHKNIPLFQFNDIEDFMNSFPKDCKLIGIEIDERAANLINYTHFPRSVYLLGSESEGLRQTTLDLCHDIIYIPSKGCLNVSATGSIILYDRLLKNEYTNNM